MGWYRTVEVVDMFRNRRRRRKHKREERRLQLLERARQDGDADARAMWLLPHAVKRFEVHGWDDLRDGGREDVIEVVDDSPEGGGLVYGFRQPWLASFRFAHRCSPRLAAFPPAFAEWFRQHPGDDHRSLSDRDKLAKDRARWERAKAQARRPAPPRQRVGGSWPTSGNPGWGGRGGFHGSVHT